MESESPVMNKQYPIENILIEASSFLKKNGNRKVILLLDKYFMSYTYNEMSKLNIKISRRLIRAAQNLLNEYIQGDNIQKVDLLLDRCNLYIAVIYINIQRMLKNERGNENYEQLNSAQIEQKIGLNRLRQRIKQLICIPESLIKVTHLKRLKEKNKIKFYLNELWILLLKQLIVYAKLFKITNEVQNSVKVMLKIEKILQFKIQQMLNQLKYSQITIKILDNYIFNCVSLKIHQNNTKQHIHIYNHQFSQYQKKEIHQILLIIKIQNQFNNTQ